MKNRTIHFQNCLGVFQGGGCRAGAFVGAYKEAYERGVSFSELVGTSAGAIVASLIGAGATPEILQELIKGLKFPELINKPQKLVNYKPPTGYWLIKPIKKDVSTFLSYAGLHDSTRIYDWVDKNLRSLLQLNRPVKFKDLIIPTTVVVSDLKTKSIKLFGSYHDADQIVAEAVRCSSNIPIFFQPIEKRYVDGGLLSNLPAFVFNDNLEPTYDRILAFSLISDDTTSYDLNSIEDYLGHLSATTIDGSTDVQMRLQKNIHFIKIPTGKIKATDFDTITDEDVASLIENGENAARTFFEKETANLRVSLQREEVYPDYFRSYNEITLSLTNAVEEVVFCDKDTEWAYDLFPTLLGWVNQNANLIVIRKENNDDELHGPYRQRVLEALGCHFLELKDIPFRGVIINGNNIPNNGIAMVFNNNTAKELPYHSKLYFGEEDEKVISLLRKDLIDGQETQKDKRVVRVKPVKDDVLFSELKNVAQYNHETVAFSVEEIEISQLTFLTKYVRGFKFRQIHTLFHLFRINNVNPFVPAVLEYPNGKESLITPPILEKIGGAYYVIEGNTRLVWASKNGFDRMHCVVVQGVTAALPSSGRYKQNEILITDKQKLGSTRYQDFNYAQFRKIEHAVRDPQKALL